MRKRTSSTISGNTAYYNGGGVYDGAGSTVTLNDSSTISGNNPNDIYP